MFIMAAHLFPKDIVKNFRYKTTAALLVMFAAGCAKDLPTDFVTVSARGFAVAAPDPIIFVHGYTASTTTWKTMISRFKTDGYTQLVDWTYGAGQPNATTAQQLAVKVDSVLRATGASKVDIITHSMGALSARYYVRNLGGNGKVDAVVSLGGPNHGTQTALLCSQASCLEMRVGSTFLKNLNSSDETWGTPRYATWWSKCDEVIIPQSSTALTGATNTQTSCLRHNDLHENATVYGQVKAFVAK